MSEINVQQSTALINAPELTAKFEYITETARYMTELIGIYGSVADLLAAMTSDTELKVEDVFSVLQEIADKIQESISGIGLFEGKTYTR